MIQRSRQLINKSRQPSLNSNSIEKYKENRRDKNVLLSSIKKQSIETASQNQKQNKTVYRQIDLVNRNQNNQSNTKKKIGLRTNQRQSKQISFRDNPATKEKSSQKKYNSIVNKDVNFGRTSNVINKSKQKSKEKGQAESPFKQIYDKGKAIYKFSPQKTSHSQSKSKEKNEFKNINTKSFHKTNQKQQSNFHIPVKQQSFKIDLSFLSKTNNVKENILIQEETELNSSNYNNFCAKQYRFKTQYTPQINNDVYNMYKLEEPSSTIDTKHQKRKINLKLFQSESKKSCLASQRSKKSIYESVKLSTRKNLVKQLGQLETQSTNEQQRKAKFILKIKKYGFVQKHLSEQQIWNIYDQLVQSNIPQLKWPIVIVDQVYRKMKLYQ